MAAAVPSAAAAPPSAPALRPGLEGDALRRACAEAVKAAEDGRFRSFAPVFHMASELAFDGSALSLRFPANVRNTAQDLAREQANPSLLRALGAARLEIAFEGPATVERPEDRLRNEPALQELLRLTGGEIVEIRRES